MKNMTILDIADEYLGYHYEVVNRSGVFSIIQQIGSAQGNNIFETQQLALSDASERFAQSEEKKTRTRNTRRYRWCKRILDRANIALDKGKNFYWSPILEPKVYYKFRKLKFWSKIENEDIVSRMKFILRYVNDNEMIPQDGYIFEYVDIEDTGKTYSVLESGDEVFKATLSSDLTVELKSYVVGDVSECLHSSNKNFANVPFNPVVWVECNLGSFECICVDGVLGLVTENANSVYSISRKVAVDWINAKKKTRLKNFKESYKALS